MTKWKSVLLYNDLVSCPYGGIVMHDFEYVSREEYQPVKNDIIDIILEVQDEVRDHFTFQYHFIGSTNRKMITRDRKSNVGYDLCMPPLWWYPQGRHF